MDFDKLNGLIPAIAQDSTTKEVLMVGFMDEEAFKKTCEERVAYYWSRSRKKLWKKGETSGNIQKVKDIRIDCDEDTVLLLVEQTGPACHTGEKTCFFRSIK